MFFVLREKAIQRRIRIEKKKKRTLSATFTGQEERQDDYLAKREKLMAQFGVDNAGEQETQQVAQVRSPRLVPANTTSHATPRHAGPPASQRRRYGAGNLSI